MRTTSFLQALLRMAYASVCLALCLVLPFLTGQIPQVGNALSPMHIPVLLSGFLCGPWWAGAVGLCAPLLRFALFGMPPMFPTGLAMSVELLTYGLVSGLLCRRLPKGAVGVYGALVGAMLSGRVVWGIAMALLSLASATPFTLSLFLAGAFLNAIPGIILHLLLIPALVFALQRAKVLAA